MLKVHEALSNNMKYRVSVPQRLVLGPLHIGLLGAKCSVTKLLNMFGLFDLYTMFSCF